MAEDENKTDSESDVLLQGAESVVSGKGSDDAPFENLSLDSDLLRNIPVTISVEVGKNIFTHKGTNATHSRFGRGVRSISRRGA